MKRKNSTFYCMVVVALSFLLFFGCSSDPENEIVPHEPKEGDIETETFVVNGQAVSYTTKVYNLAEPNEEPVLVVLPLDSGDSIYNEIIDFMNQTSTSASELKAYGDKYYLSVAEFLNLAKGASPKNRSSIDISYDDLRELDEFLNEFQQTFGETEVFSLILLLDELGLTWKEFVSISEDVRGDDYIDWMLEEYKNLDNLYTDYINSGEETYKKFLEGNRKRSAIIIAGIAINVLEWAYNLCANDAMIPNAQLQPKTISILHPDDVRAVQQLPANLRPGALFTKYYGAKTASFPFGYDATGIHYHFNVDYAYGAKSRYGLPGNNWIPKITVIPIRLATTHMCPIYTYHVPNVKIMFQRPVDISKTPNDYLPEIIFTVHVRCYMKAGAFCTITFWKNNYFRFKLNGRDGLKFIAVGKR